MDSRSRGMGVRAPIRRVAKRDGRSVDYDPGRIAEAVMHAQAAVGERDEQFAAEVAEVVDLALHSLHSRLAEPDELPPPAGEPDIEEIQDLVERALVEMGRAAVAKAYILYRDRRARARTSLRVKDPALKVPGRPRVLEPGGSSAWSRERIVAALVEESDLPRDTAAKVASRVEKRVFDAGLTILSSALVRELVAAELGTMGLGDIVRPHASLSVARHDLRRFFESPPAGPADPHECYSHGERGAETEVARALLSRYSLEDVLNSRCAELHAGGDLFVEDVSRPHLPLVRSLPCELLLRGAASGHAAFEVLEELAPLLAGTARGLVLEDSANVLAPLRGSASLRDFLRSLAALSAATGRELDLSAPGGRSGVFIGRLLVESAALTSEGSRSPRLFLTWAEALPALEADPKVRAAAETLLAHGRLVPVWHAAQERWVAPGCRRQKREKVALACGGAVALNLPRLARAAGPWREDLMLEGLLHLVESSLDALESIQRFQNATRAARGDSLRERTAFALTPVGLVDALRILGDGQARAEHGARLLGVCSDATRRLAAERGLNVVLSPFFGDRARFRFADADADRRRASQPRLFDELPSPEDARGAPYHTGYAALEQSLSQGSDVPARTLSTVPSGALFPFLRSAELKGEHPGLDVWRRFDTLRRPAEDPTLVRAGAAEGTPLFQGGYPLPRA